MHRIFEAVRDVIDSSRLRSREETFVAHVFGLMLIVLAAAVVECLKAPEKTDTYRRHLLTELDIIRCGSLSAAEAEKEDMI